MNYLESSLKECIGRSKKGCEEDVMESQILGRKDFLYEGFVYIEDAAKEYRKE